MPLCTVAVPVTLDLSGWVHVRRTRQQIDIGPIAPEGMPAFQVNSERWTEDLFGEGATTGYDHVIINPVCAVHCARMAACVF